MMLYFSDGCGGSYHPGFEPNLSKVGTEGNEKNRSLKLTYPLKMDGWNKIRFLLVQKAYFEVQTCC